MTKMRRFQLGIFHEPMSIIGRLVKLADTPDLGSGAERRRGSTPRAATFLSFGRQALKHRCTGGGRPSGAVLSGHEKSLVSQGKTRLLRSRGERIRTFDPLVPNQMR